MKKSSTPSRLEDDLSDQFNGPSLIPLKTKETESCNGCVKYFNELWLIRLNGLAVRLCEDCFTRLEKNRQWYKQSK